MSFIKPFMKVLLPATLAALALQATANTPDAGPLDLTLPATVTEKPGKPGVTTLTLQPSLSVQVANPAQTQQILRDAVALEQSSLEKLDRDELQTKAENGERAAQVVLGADFAQEAALLSFAPAAANDALSDAAKWYSLAASRGFPGAPSLDQAGIRFYPIRIQRERRP